MEAMNIQFSLCYQSSSNGAWKTDCIDITRNPNHKIIFILTSSSEVVVGTLNYFFIGPSIDEHIGVFVKAI